MDMIDDGFLSDYAYAAYTNMLGGIWTMRDGTEIAVTSMTTSHIRNCMRMVGTKHGWYRVFAEELERRGEKV